MNYDNPTVEDLTKLIEQATNLLDAISVSTNISLEQRPKLVIKTHKILGELIALKKEFFGE